MCETRSGAIRAQIANCELRRNSRNLDGRDAFAFKGRENGVPLVTAIVVDGAAILGPSCKADCKLVALATYLLFRTKRSDTGLHGGVCGPLQVMKASNVLPSPWGMGTLPPVPLQCPMVGLAAADGLHTTPYDTRPAICMVEYGI